MAKGEVTVKVNVEMVEDVKELIRQIVREEIAAHKGRPFHEIEIKADNVNNNFTADTLDQINRNYQSALNPTI